MISVPSIVLMQLTSDDHLPKHIFLLVSPSPWEQLTFCSNPLVASDPVEVILDVDISFSCGHRLH